MATHLSLNDHLDVLEHRGAALRDAAARAGLDAPVPTCPDWNVAALVTHQGMVHRWAAANLRGDRDHRTEDSEAAAAAATDLLAWYADGLDALIATLHATPDDAEAMVFLKDAPPPRRFWARRQAHETTIHSADAVAAASGRWLTAADLTIAPTVAADGIDELLCGFVPRGKGTFRSERPYTLVINAHDIGRSWSLRVSADALVTTTGADADADAELSGTAVELYLGLWNRGDEITAEGHADVLEQWRSHVRIRWS